MKKFLTHTLPIPVFDEYNKSNAIQDALGSKRARQRQEATTLSTNYKENVSGYALTPTDIKNVPLISTGIVAPTSTPLKIGDMFIDTVAGKVYVATGTTSSADYKLLN